jgi:hypothetical protein
VFAGKIKISYLVGKYKLRISEEKGELKVVKVFRNMER